jgi:hypothetical protein
MTSLSLLRSLRCQFSRYLGLAPEALRCRRSAAAFIINTEPACNVSSAAACMVNSVMEEYRQRGIQV